MSEVSIRTLILEFVDSNGASHIHEMHIEVLRQKPGTPEHTIIWLILRWWKSILVGSDILYFHPGLFVQNMGFDAGPQCRGLVKIWRQPF